MTAAAANAIIVKLPDAELREYPVVASDIIYRDTFVGLNPAGLLKPFEVGDEFVGIAYEKADNASGAAAAIKCRVYVKCDFVFALTSAANLDSGKALFATDDSTIDTVGHPDAWVGQVLHKDVDASGKVVVRMREPHEKWQPSMGGAIEYVLNGQFLTPTGAAGAAADVLEPAGLVAASVVGLGVKNVLIDGAAYDLEFDAVAEVADASIRCSANLLASKGATLEADLHMTNIGDNAALDADWGLCTLTDTASVRADIETAADLAMFHMDGNSANILAQSDNGTTDVAPTDTTIDNVTTALSYKKFKTIVRPSGTVEFWIDGVRALASTVFAVATTALLGGIVNIEKTSDDTVAVLRMKRLRIAGAAD